ncbi:VOC family protein [Azoarcus olearius]|uniref:Lactoylglutathione lyase n=1 Tax=Azoarcus sp. (strain BH72) TaxID=418699 RepID=A1K8W6_AZOSB|nr:VOC family protein [Azoarcus olearius]CAL95271.1 lactoylglutathione lyase [Azoarcus olearius]
MDIKPIPEGYRSITPYLSIDCAAAAIDFYRRAFGATEQFRLALPDGSVGHAELRIGDSTIMLADGCEQGVARSPRTLGGSSVGLHLYVEDVDAVYAQAVAAGARAISEPKDQFYGDRSGTLEDPFGHMWFVASHKEDLLPAEIEKRVAALFGDGKG